MVGFCLKEINSSMKIKSIRWCVRQRPLQLWRHWRSYRMLSLKLPPLDASDWQLSALVAEVRFHVWKSRRAWASFSIQSSLSCLVSAENQHLDNNNGGQCMWWREACDVTMTAKYWNNRSISPKTRKLKWCDQKLETELLHGCWQPDV